MSVADKVDVPVLMLLGGKDKRVPNYEGKNYVHWLRSRGVEADCFIFPEDGHALDSGESSQLHTRWINDTPVIPIT